jgi:hypothetical protein
MLVNPRDPNSPVLYESAKIETKAANVYQLTLESPRIKGRFYYKDFDNIDLALAMLEAFMKTPNEFLEL